jgi:cytochrome c-type biogenesis protein CcmE
MFALLGGIGIAAIVALLLFVGAAPEGYLTVTEAKSGGHTSREIKVRGDVVDWNPKGLRFVLTDNVSTLLVDYNKVPGGAPPSFGPGKHVVVRGMLHAGYLDAQEITVGCPPEYKDG